EEPLEALLWRGVEWLMAPFGLLAVVPALLVGVVAGRRDLLGDVASRRRPLLAAAVVGVAVGWLGGLPMALATGGAVALPAESEAGFSGLHVLRGVACGRGYAALAGGVCAPRALVP